MVKGLTFSEIIFTVSYKKFKKFKKFEKENFVVHRIVLINFNFRFAKIQILRKSL